MPKGRKVRAFELAALNAAVDAHSTLSWDVRMQALARAEGIVMHDDPKDGTSKVNFPSPIDIVAWLPTNILVDV